MLKISVTSNVILIICKFYGGVWCTRYKNTWEVTKGHGRSHHNERHNIRSISFIVRCGTLLEWFPMFSKTFHLVDCDVGDFCDSGDAAECES
jgi:hypothetical protein